MGGGEMHKDCLGNSLYVGDFISYASMNGYSPSLHFGMILELKTKDNKPKLLVRSDLPSWRGGFKLSSRAITLEKFDRVLLIERSNLPDSLVNNLEKGE
jgi:hypothetical protein